jgi:predicted amidohydrolase YtcJ
MKTLLADLALIEATVRTMNPSQPIAEAAAIKKDRIIKVGTTDEVNRLIGKNTHVISLEGKTVLPGFIDTHIHVADFGRFLMWLDLRGINSITGLLSSLKEQVQKTPIGKWIVGRGWNQESFREKHLPTLWDLDLVSPNNPVILYHESEMICVVNSKALDSAGITRLTPSPSKGVIEKDAETGELTGILRDEATNLVWRSVPEPSESEILDAVALACEKIAAAGVTSVHWLILSAAELSIIRKLHARRKLPVRVYVIIPANLLGKKHAFDSIDSSVLRIGAAMTSADGYLASRTAALFQPYKAKLAGRGELLRNPEELYTETSRILGAGLQPVIHAMGDRAVEAALSAFERNQIESSRMHLRCRIEHAAVLNETLIERLKKQQVIVSVQPRVMISEFSVWSAIENLGVERARWLYPLKSLQRKGVRVIGGSDCPMEPLNPLLAMQDAVSREYFAEERVGVE